MNCKDFRELLPLAAAQNLSDESRQEVEQHLAECPDCRLAYEELKATVDLLTGGEADDLSDIERLRLENQVLRRLSSSGEARAQRVQFSAVRTALRFAAVIALLAIGYTAYPLLGPPGTTPTRSTSPLANVSDSPESVRSAAAVYRYSGAGLKLIAGGTQSLSTSSLR